MAGLADKLGAIGAAAAVLGETSIPFAIIGGVTVHIRSGGARATLDVNLAIPTTVDRARLVRRLVQRGFTWKGTFAHSVNLEHTSGERLQLAFDREFDSMIARADCVLLGNIAVSVVTKEDLIVMKRRAAADRGRTRSKALRDQADLALLEGDVPSPDDGW
jgi:predicted nucleotidyltransferase